MSMAIISGIATTAAAADTIYNNYQNQGSGGGGGKGPEYTPSWLAGSDIAWQNAFDTNTGLNKTAYNAAMPAYTQSFNNSQAINYQPYQTAANQAGQQYNNVANTANTQMGQYQNAGNLDFNAGNQIYQQAFDPNLAQFNQTQQQLQDQVNAGQAMRGLGNSGQGAQEYNNAMQNFDIGWNTQQLQNENIGLQGMGQAQMAGQRNFGAATQAGGLSATDLMLGASTPLQAQQMIAGMPATNAAAYTNNINNLEGMYANQMNEAIPYMNNGQGAQQWNADYNTAQNAASMQALMQGGQQLSNAFGSNGGDNWLNNMFSGSPQTQNYNNMINQNQQTVNGYVPDMMQSVSNQSVDNTLSQVPSWNPYTGG